MVKQVIELWMYNIYLVHTLSSHTHIHIIVMCSLSSLISQECGGVMWLVCGGAGVSVVEECSENALELHRCSPVPPSQSWPHTCSYQQICKLGHVTWQTFMIGAGWHCAVPCLMEYLEFYHHHSHHTWHTCNMPFLSYGNNQQMLATTNVGIFYSQ